MQQPQTVVGEEMAEEEALGAADTEPDNYSRWPMTATEAAPLAEVPVTVVAYGWSLGYWLHHHQRHFPRWVPGSDGQSDRVVAVSATKAN